MSAGSKIEWCDHTFNPWWGCAKVSPGCNHCYAEGVADRWGHQVWGAKADRRFFGDKHWAEPLKWNRAAEAAGDRARVFSGSMCDVFEDRNDLLEHRGRLAEVIAATPWLDWLLLTKRPENVAALAPWGSEWPANVWLGTSVEDQRRADERIPHLLALSAAVRFLSCEPLLGPVRLKPEWLEPRATVCGRGPTSHEGRAAITEVIKAAGRQLGWTGIDWVIVGGESGPGARPMHPQWARDLRDQCVGAGVPFFFKQWGEWAPSEHHPYGQRHEAFDGAVVRVGKKAAGRELDGRTWDEFPQTAVPA